MNPFEGARQIPTREIAEREGAQINRAGMTLCPFHNDRNPSMKVDERFHCFACGADGDGIDFVARLYGLSKLQAAVKICEDFGIPYEKGKPPDRKAVQKRQLQRERQIRFEKTEKRFVRILTDYIHLMEDWKEEHAPRSPGDEWDERFQEAVRNLPRIESLVDRFMDADLEERIDLINEHRNEVKELAGRLKQYRSG